ncbi:MAG: sigma 54-interacting transcriptional regulator [Myxococcaceae bacterium]|nr:sigma 54-interacting transcriptional regulator [Myxococcaceae bacterium]
MSREKTHTLTFDGSPAPEKVLLEVISGAQVQRHLIGQGTWRVGGEQTCDVVLEDPTVSRQHAVLELTRTGLTVKDLGSRNRTWYLGAAITEASVPLGATIRFGKTLVRVSQDPASTPGVVEAPPIPGLLGESPPMRRLVAALRRVAAESASVLLRGETGVGKEQVARAIHTTSPRASGPFVVFDCSRGTSELIESDLFGHQAGAFTGAVSQRIGAIERANGGTLFLDEIGELDVSLQPRLLRVLESRTFSRVGDTTTRSSDFRLVAASHRDLEAMVKERKFREDLFFRLAVVVLDVPPLRERRDDIPILARAFAGDQAHRLSDATLASWLSQPWPGNVRELRNAVERALLELNPEPKAAASRATVLDSVDKVLVEQALEKASFDVNEAAKLLNLSRSQVYRLMQKLGISPKRRRT